MNLAPFERPRAILLDIEGTTSPLAFVHKVLFPYARREAEAYLRENAHAPDVVAALEKMALDDGAPTFADWNPLIWPTPAAQTWLLEKIYRWMEADAKLTGLKQLQGQIWEHGYRNGAYRSLVFEDVPCKLREWQVEKIPVYIYSSGSVEAQKLLFAHTEDGDLTPLLRGYFDTTIGTKRAATSYRAIAQKLELEVSTILFFSDRGEELQAAHEAGLATVLVVRPGNQPNDASEHPRIESFKEIKFG